MKQTKRFASIATAALLAACAVVPSMTSIPASAAATPNTISFTNSDENDTASHVYTAYKIFTGNVGDSGALEGIQWAAGDTKGAAFLTALKADTTIGTNFASCDTAAAVAEVLAKENGDSELLQNFAAFAATQTTNLTKVNTAASATIDVTTSGDGYYLLVDDTDLSNATGAKTRYLIAQVDASAGLEIAVKSALPTVEKKIKENAKTPTYGTDANETETYVGTGYNDVADYSIGDTVPFKLIGTLPSKLADYKKGYKYVFHDTLDSQFTAPAKSVIKVNIDGTDVTSQATISVSGQEITVTFDNIKAISGVTADSIVTVTYNAVLSENAEIGLDGQKNTVYLEYSNNPNWNGEGTPDTSKTPDDKVIAFTYELDLTKVDKTSQAALTGAKFKLQATDGEHANKYAVLTAVDGTPGAYKVTSWVDSADDATAFENASGNTFAVIGLDSGKYNLYETAAPAGYKVPTEPFALEITATTKNDQDWDSFEANNALTALTIKVGTADATDGDLDKGSVSAKIENTSGSTLPSTGGIGTTIFYVAGGVLVVGAGVLLITKKRAKNMEA